ncbi:hypothetical protein [Pedobacter nutrimenti]|nr:hypothetical protein [Pedobacter nutrimenti]
MAKLCTFEIQRFKAMGVKTIRFDEIQEEQLRKCMKVLNVSAAQKAFDIMIVKHVSILEKNKELTQEVQDLKNELRRIKGQVTSYFRATESFNNFVKTLDKETINRY